MGLFDWFKGKKSPAQEDVPPRPVAPSAGPAPAPATRSWKTGDRVLATWLDAYFYPGRVRQTKGNLYEIAFDDGDAAWVHEANVRLPDIRVGSKVFCRLQGGPYYHPATVREQNDEKIQVEYDNGNKEWTTISMVRVQRAAAEGDVPPAMPSQPPAMMMNPNMLGGFPVGMGGVATMTSAGPMMVPPPNPGAPDVGEPVTESDWRIGDRVLGRWYDLYWYPATILAIGTKGYHLLFDDGDQRVVQDLGLMPLAVEEGEEVFIRQKNQPMKVYTPGRVLSVHGEMIDVSLEDGTQEHNQKVSRARFWRCPVGVSATSFEEGDRVWATDIDGFTYPAEILSIEDDKIIVQFLDGPERMLTPELIKRFTVKPGAAVTCRWKAGQVYFPGKIAEIDGDRVHIAYDDGEKEWTTVRLLRLPPADASQAGEFRPGKA